MTRPKPEPTRFRRAWAAWLDAGSGDEDTNRELGDSLAELLTDALVEQAPPEWKDDE